MAEQRSVTRVKSTTSLVFATGIQIELSTRRRQRRCGGKGGEEGAKVRKTPDVEAFLLSHVFGPTHSGPKDIQDAIKIGISASIAYRARQTPRPVPR